MKIDKLKQSYGVPDNMEWTGTDVSIETCMKEGYLFAEFPKDESQFDENTPCRIFQTYPDYSKKDINYDKVEDLDDILIEWYEYSFNDLVEMYEKRKEDIDSFSETNEHVNFGNPEISDFITLADDINCYCGLD